MNNAYVIFLENLYESEWELLKKVDKTDKVIFLIDKDGLVPYQVVPYLYNLDTEPKMYPFANTDDMALAFILGGISTFISGTCYLIGADESFGTVDTFNFEFEDLNMSIELKDTLEEALSDKRKGKSVKKSAHPKDAKPEADNSFTPQYEDDFENETENNADVQEEISFDDYEPAPKNFVAALSKFATDSFDLMQYKDIIYVCVQESIEDVMDTFEFQLNVRIQKDDSKKIYDILKDHVEELRKF